MTPLQSPTGNPVLVNLKKAVFVIDHFEADEEGNKKEEPTGNSLVIFPGDQWMIVKGRPSDLRSKTARTEPVNPARRGS